VRVLRSFDFRVLRRRALHLVQGALHLLALVLYLALEAIHVPLALFAVS
jgi:hypothetical protein